MSATPESSPQRSRRAIALPWLLLAFILLSIAAYGLKHPTEHWVRELRHALHALSHDDAALSARQAQWQAEQRAREAVHRAEAEAFVAALQPHLPTRKDDETLFNALRLIDHTLDFELIYTPTTHTVPEHIRATLVDRYVESVCTHPPLRALIDAQYLVRYRYLFDDGREAGHYTFNRDLCVRLERAPGRAQRIAAQANTAVPHQIDTATTLTQVEAKGRELIFHYIVHTLDADAAGLALFKARIPQLIPTQTCFDPAVQAHLRSLITPVFAYLDTQGRPFGQLRIDSHTCVALGASQVLP